MPHTKTIRRIVDVRDAVPGGMILAMAVVNTLWNLHAGIVWRAPLMAALAFPMWPLVVGLVYATVRPDRQIAEAALFIALWMIYGIFAEQLTYLIIALDHPLRDATIAKIDATMGLNWRAWTDFFSARAWSKRGSAAGLPELSLAAVSFGRDPCALASREGNAELLTGLIIASAAAFIIAAFLPVHGTWPTWPVSPARGHGRRYKCSARGTADRAALYRNHSSFRRCTPPARFCWSRGTAT